MSDPHIRRVELRSFPLWGPEPGVRRLRSFEVELTARCNQDCRHCNVCLPANDKAARTRELSCEDILEIGKAASQQGAVWCLLTGGEPLLRDDFLDIYLGLKRLGLLVTVFTNATLISKEHVRWFQRYPPRDIEVSVYGATRATYEAVTRTTGSHERFLRGVNLLRKSSVPVRFKAMALKANLPEFEEIKAFCRRGTKDYFRYDPFLTLRHDGDGARNEEIRSQRLSVDEVVNLERSDPDRMQAMASVCTTPVRWSRNGEERVDPLFKCGAGMHGFSLRHDGFFRLCSTLNAPECLHDLRRGRLDEAWNEFVPDIRAKKICAGASAYECGSCGLMTLCMWCPGNAHLETGRMDVKIEPYCEMARGRAKALRAAAPNRSSSASNTKIELDSPFTAGS